MIRSEYWNRTNGLLDWCNDSELRVLEEQLKKALKARHDKNLVKFEETEHRKRKRAATKVKRASKKLK